MYAVSTDSNSQTNDTSCLTMSSSSGAVNLAVVTGTATSSAQASSRESSYGPSSEGRGRKSLPRPYDTLPYAGPVFDMDGNMLKWKSANGWRSSNGQFCQAPTSEEVRHSVAYEKSLEKAMHLGVDFCKDFL